MVQQLIAGLPADEFQQSLIHGGQGSLTAWCRKNGIPEKEVPTTSVASSLLRIGKVVSAFRNFSPDVAILHGQWAGPIGAIASQWAGVPCSIYIAHWPAFYHSSSHFRAIRNYIAERIPCARCDRVVTLSDGSYYNYLYRGWVAENRILKIHNGIDTNSHDERPHSSKPSSPPWIAEQGVPSNNLSGSPSAYSSNAVFVGRINDQKRVDWLLHAWKHTTPRQGWHLWIVGDGKELHLCETLANQLGIRNSVSFVGNKSNAVDWIGAADLLVLSSLFEGHALVPLEAMACSKPVVAFATDGVSDSILHEQTGLLAPLGDTALLGSHIARLLANPEEARRMGKAGNEHLKTHFSIKKTITAYSQLLRELKPHPSNRSQRE